MKAVYDFIPTYCPNCGAPTGVNHKYYKADYNAKCTHTCDCGVQFQKADTDKIKKAAIDSGGDADRHW